MLSVITFATMLLSLIIAQELGVLHLRLEGMREKCLVEELPANTVALGNLISLLSLS
jgi:hypothetical protein